MLDIFDKFASFWPPKCLNVMQCFIAKSSFAGEQYQMSSCVLCNVTIDKQGIFRTISV